MNHYENTLESIIKAARTMAGRQAETSSQLPGKKEKSDEADHRDSGAAVSSDVSSKTSPDTDTPVLPNPSSSGFTPVQENTSGTALTKEDENKSSAESESALRTAGIHFLEFAVAFLTLAKCQYQQDNDVKVNSLPFFTLVALDSWADSDYTMSELADKLQITKQQLSRLINVLEEKGLVERIHDTANRRRVYIRICPNGREMMNSVKQCMLDSTLYGLRAYSEDELRELDQCICRLIQLMEKFNTDPTA